MDHPVVNTDEINVLLAMLPDGILVMHENSLLYINQNASRILGYTDEVLLNTPLNQIFLEQDYAYVLDRVSDVLAKKTTQQIDARVNSATGDICHVELNLAYVMWQGKPCVLATVRENGQRHRMTVAIESLAKFDITRSLDEFYTLCVSRLADVYDARFAFIGLRCEDNHERIRTQAVWCNGQQLENFEYDLEGTPCADILDLKKELIPRDAAKLYPTDTMLVDMGVDSYFGAPLITPEGDMIGLVSVMDTKPMYVDGVAASTLSVFASRITAEITRQQARDMILELNDTLERKVLKRTRELEKLREEDNQANSAKTSFMTKMSHELRTPMNAILGFGQLLQLADTLSEEHLDWVNEMMTSGHHLLALINEMLDIARIEAGHFKLEISPVALGTVMKESLSSVTPLAEERDIHLQVNRDPQHAACHVMADQLRLKQVLLNLLSNAIKYNQKDGSISVSCEDVDDKFIRIIIADTGIGMTKQQLALIYEPFERFAAEASGVQGTGIGMTITRHLVTLMGGKIDIDSIPGQGTTVMIDLPVVDKKSTAMNSSKKLT